MRKFFCRFFVILFIFSFTTSCNNKTLPQDQKKSNTGSIQSIPAEPEVYHETPTQPTPIPTPPAPPAQNPTPNQKAVEPKKASPKPKTVVVGRYSTPLLNKDKDRVSNIKLAAKTINGYKLTSGKTFSFNDIVGKRDEEHGYKIAAVIINGDYDEDIGGGVCQLSSTLFNAADKAGLQIIERHSHSKAVSYVPEGHDAAVNYGTKDLKFKNTKDYTVEIRTWVRSGKVYASIVKAA